MKNFELQPTDENIVKTFLSDALDRNEDVFNFLKLLLAIDSNYSIALNGFWGSGKTFFVKQIEMVLAVCNNFVENDYVEYQIEIKEKTNKSDDNLINNLKKSLYIPVYYDAWENDDDEDPVFSILFAILTKLKEEALSKEIQPNIKLIIASLSQFFLKMDVSEWVKKEDFLQDLKNSKKIKTQLNELIELLLLERGKRFVIFIDELDRCRPDFAVKLLERIKHYFTNPNIVFVFSTNLSELQHTISNFYGANFSSDRYLDRFFDLKVTLPKPNPDVVYRCFQYDGEDGWISEVYNTIIITFEMELRDIAKFLTKIKIVQEKQKTANMFESDRLWCFIHWFMLPVAYALQIMNMTNFKDFISGNNVEPLTIVFDSLESVSDFFERTIVFSDETLYKDTTIRRTGSEETVDIDTRIKEMYLMPTEQKPFSENSKP